MDEDDEHDDNVNETFNLNNNDDYNKGEDSNNDDNDDALVVTDNFLMTKL